MVIGILAIILGFIPGCGIVTALPAAVIGLILGIVEISLKSKKGESKKMGTAGLILNILAIVIVIVVTLIIMPQLKKGVAEAKTEWESSMREVAAEVDRAVEEVDRAVEEAESTEESAPEPPVED